MPSPVYPQPGFRCPPGTHLVHKYATSYGVTAGGDAGATRKLTPITDVKVGVNFGVNATKPGDMVQVCEPDDPNHHAPRGFGPEPRNMTDQDLANRIRHAQEALDDARAKLEIALNSLEECKAAQAQGHPAGAGHTGPDPNSAYEPAGMCRDCVDCSQLEAEFDKAAQEYRIVLEQWQYLAGMQDERRAARETGAP